VGVKLAVSNHFATVPIPNCKAPASSLHLGRLTHQVRDNSSVLSDKSIFRFFAGFNCLAAAALLASCSLEPPPPCPTVRIDSNTARFTEYREGLGRDITDIQYTAELVGFGGSCVHGDDGVTVMVDINFVVTSGPAAVPGPIKVYYFVAIPQFFPDPVGKKVFDLEYAMSDGTNQSKQVSEKGIRVFIPLDTGKYAASYDIYVGLQLTNDQLRENQRRLR